MMANRKGQSGFSLIELVVVITIMAVLIGIVGVAVLPFIEKARQAKDYQVVSELCTIATSSFSENASLLEHNTPYEIESTNAGDSYGTLSSEVVTDIKKLSGNESVSSIYELIHNQLVSKEGKDADSVRINYQSNGVVVVQLYVGSEPLWDSVSSK